MAIDLAMKVLIERVLEVQNKFKETQLFSVRGVLTFSNKDHPTYFKKHSTTIVLSVNTLAKILSPVFHLRGLQELRRTPGLRCQA